MYQRILVPVDGSPTSRRGLAEAIRLAKLTQARLRLLHVVDALSFSLSASGFGTASGDVFGMLRESGQAILTGAKAEVDKAGVPVDTVLYDTLEGRVCDQVVDEAIRWDADLIVLGTHGRRGVGRLVLGSDAEQVVRVSPVPVLLVRGTDKA